MSLPIRTHGFPKEAGAPLSLYRDAADVKRHPYYNAAKAGDIDAALHLARDLITPAALEEARSRFPPGTRFLPAISREATGHNQIPMAVACVLAHHTGGEVVTDIVQVNEPHHTGADPMERLRARPLFGGPVNPGATYVVVDDVSTLGATLSEAADHVIAGGGKVAGAFVLANASRSGMLTPQPAHVKLVEQRFGDDVRQVLGINPAALTRDEAQYLAGFRHAAEFRNRALAAESEAGRRLLSKRVAERYPPAVSPSAEPPKPKEHGPDCTM